jgi:hypothetical protein
LERSRRSSSHDSAPLQKPGFGTMEPSPCYPMM